MNKSVPTLLGVAVLLLVVVLVVLIYNIQLTKQLGVGASVVGTVGGEKLTGVEQPKVEASPSEALAKQAEKHETVSAQALQRKRMAEGKVEKVQTRQERREEKKLQQAEKPGK